MADIRKHSNTSNIIRLAFKNSSTGVPLTGLTFASSGLIISTIADNEATATAYTAAGSTIETIATLGTFATPTATKCRFREVDATNHPGLYEIQIADARFSVASARRLVISASGAANLLATDYEIRLVAYNPDDTVRMGLTSLPNAAADAAGGLPISDAGGLDLDTKLANTNEVTAARMGALTDWINGGRLDLIIDAIKAVTDNIPDSGALTALIALVDDLETRLTAARAGYLDNLSAGAVAQASVCTATRLAELDAANLPATTDAILADTGTDGVVVAAGSKTGYALSSAGIQAIWDALTSALTTAGSIGKRMVDYLTGDSFARLGAPAGASVSADIAAIKAETASILVDTGTTLDGKIDTVDTVVDAIKVVTDALTAASAAKLAASSGTMVTGTVDNSAHTPTATEFEADDITEATADHYNGRIIIFTSGVLSGQAAAISDYALSGVNGHFTVTAMTEAPANNDTFIIV